MSFEEFKKELFGYRKQIDTISIGVKNRRAEITLYDGKKIIINGKDKVHYLAMVFSVR